MRPERAGADLPLPTLAMTFAPFASAFLAAGLLAAGAGVVGPALPPAQGGAPAARPSEAPARFTQPGATALEELVVPADSVLGLQLETAVTAAAADEERVVARVTRDVMVGGRVAVPTGTRALGAATFVEKGPKGKEGPRIEIRFDTLELPRGDRVDIDTEPVVREAGSRMPGLTRLGGGAAGGAAVGAILGGGKGAAIGGLLGAAGAAATTPDRSEVVELRQGTVLSVRTKGEFRVRVGR